LALFLKSKNFIALVYVVMSVPSHVPRISSPLTLGAGYSLLTENNVCLAVASQIALNNGRGIDG
jgi:hypothetical protein